MSNERSDIINDLINKKITLISWNYLLNFFEDSKSDLNNDEIEILGLHSEKCRIYLNDKYREKYDWEYISKKDIRINILDYLQDKTE